MKPTPWRLAVDTGGTFTDVVAVDPAGRRHTLKVPSTPADPGLAIRQALAALGASGPLAHGTTVATNALLERRLGRVVLVTTAGFEDVLWLRRQARPDLYALHPVVPPPVVDRADVLGLPARRDAHGGVLEPLPDLDAWVAANHATFAGAEAFAVCLLHAYADGADEAALVAALGRAFPGVPCTASHQLCPVFREYERMATVAVNAALIPRMGAYLAELTRALAPAPLAVMGSAGGLMTAEAASEAPVHTVLSGPAGGVRGAWAVGQRAGRSALLAFDMGGTSTDVAVIQGTLTPEDEGELAQHPLRVPLLPIETVGAGGGSLAWIDDGGALRVGPRSAGAEPGPACYGRGGAAPTVTDANVVLGRLTHLLGGSIRLDAAAAHAAIAPLAERLGATTEATAAAIVAIAEATMARACKRVSMSRGVDPRGLALVAFGGAGGLHACALADALGCPEVLFPAEPGALSAEGILAAPAEVSVTRSLHAPEAAWQADALAATCAGLAAELQARLPTGVQLQILADCRYRGQTHALPLDLGATPPTPAGLRAALDAEHARRYGHALPDRPAELVALRLFLRAAPPALPTAAEAPPATALGPTAVPVYSATLWLPAHWQATRLPTGDLVCSRRAPTPAADAAALSLEVFQQQIAAVAEEMGTTLMRAAFSANIKERKDFSCAVFDARGRMLAHAAHIPVHLGSTPLSVQAAIAAVPMAPGMSVLLNDPFAGGTHLPDVTLVTPVFLPGEAAPAFFVANRAHHADIGGVAAGSLPSPRRADGSVRPLTIDDEGFRVGPTPLDDALRARFAAASRTPDERVGDLRAQEAANAVGARRLAALASATLADALLDHAERRMRAVLAALPDGAWHAEDWLEDDGTGDEPIALPLTLTVAADTATFDFRAAPPQVDGPVNAVRAITLSAVFYALRCLAGDDLPANDGLLRPITVLTRPGSVVDAVEPAAVSAGNVETSQRLVDVIFAALAQAAPDRVPAAACGSMNNALFGGVGPAGPFVHYETLGGGGGGGPAGPGADGIHVHMTNTLNTPVEALEQTFPVRIDRYALAPPHAVPPGVTRGGRGIVRTWRFLVPAEVTLMTERRRLAPPGSGGAPAGPRGHNRLLRADGTAVPLPGKVTLRVAPGEAVEMQTPGGGAWRPTN
ncbi:MAG: hydantoinase B/oxoprolinase family protein [Myxococcales bacterium]|nr:hydantoinase B/oxoprolinase family protein [Myxococcales bacterium]